LFEQGPGPGARVGDLDLAVPWKDSARLFELLHGTAHTLFLFDGRAETSDGYRSLSRLARAVRDRYGDLIHTFVVTPHGHPPPALDWDGALVLDPGGELHRRFGARAECLYLVRPDGYVGYRSQPADQEKLMEYLAGVLVA
jgi:hypothetical protein